VIVATLKTAFIAGLYSGAVEYFLGPWIVRGGAISLVVGFLILILPAYFFVLGTEGQQVITIKQS